MATLNLTQAAQAVHHAAELLAGVDWLDHDEAHQLEALAEAAVNMFTVIYYQANTGRATHADFREAVSGVRQRLEY
ncbi:type I toxin-antitoxin system ptaRNA1 family toxin [Variovorax sp. V59]|uniref:type I toxin-antitoxin system ptaRNA1 family toxin n=1 Tax=unclassified Variovorax TaxID=663243 RepID=UPI0034E8EE7C